jgi:hypothetical protein
LNAADSEQALFNLWQLIDELTADVSAERQTQIRAAQAGLGLSDTRSDVNARLATAYHKLVPENRTTNQLSAARSGRRYAYAGIDQIATELIRRYSMIYAFGAIDLISDDEVSVGWMLGMNVEMQDPVVTLTEYPLREDQEIQETIITGSDVRPTRTGFKEWSLLIEWSGEAVPTWQFATDRKANVYATPTSFSVACEW